MFEIQKRLVKLGYPNLQRGYSLGDLIKMLPQEYLRERLTIKIGPAYTWVVSYKTKLQTEAQTLEEACCLMIEKIHANGSKS